MGLSGLKVIPLVCPDCGRSLAGLRYDQIFFCMTCKQGLENDENNQWVRYPLRFADVEIPPGIPVLYLPFWKIAISTEVNNTTRKQDVACRLLANLHNVWVSGFSLIRPSYFGDVGLAYTEKGANPQAAQSFPAGFYVGGCTRTVTEALRYMRLFVTLMLDKRSDVTGMEIDITHSDISLWATPFLDMGDKIKDVISDIELPAFALDDLEDVRRINRRK